MVERAAEWIKAAEGILICTGAGMGVSSGLGTFRGVNAGVWPPLVRLGIDFSEMSCPARFVEDERLAWSFWNFRYSAYTGNPPHEGYSIMKRWGETKPAGYFCFTSNIDGHWLEAQVPEDRVIECHGSVRFMQCQRLNEECSHFDKIWPADPASILRMQIDPETDKVTSELPKCPGCRGTARPNVMMFSDFGVQEDRIDGQYDNFFKWRKSVQDPKRNLVVVEIGAGVAVPTVRLTSEGFCRTTGAKLIRVNPEHPNVPFGIEHISLTLGALDFCQQIDAILNQLP
eukprot:TRINITY_DN3663_c0_g1_i1.p1 TRINITY_DN3663_c0_g1~~TRINITY_DN3663_c0_g1_i1.p1  ORF type:complete len:286 (+),score=98.85 TRINITY_DN3663_c0_g1_i1:41-898(+)